MIQKEGLREEDTLTKQIDEVMEAKEHDELVQSNLNRQNKEDDATYQIKDTSLLVYAVSLFVYLDIWAGHCLRLRVTAFHRIRMLKAYA